MGRSALPPYEQLADRIRRMISSRRLVPGAFLGTEAGFARTSGRARMTVRRAVETLIASGVLERRPGRGVFVRDDSHETRTIRLLAGNLGWEPAVRILHGVQEAAEENGVRVEIEDAHGDLETALTSVRALPDSGAGGAVLVSLHCPAFNEALCALVARGFPFVVVDQTLSEIAAPSVSSDNTAGGASAAGAVIAAGHRHLAFVGDLDASTTRARLAGVNAAARRAGLGSVLVIDLCENDRLGDWAPQIHRAVIRAINAKPRPTALVCSCDAVARGAYRTLRELQVAVPGDVSVVGFDDDPIAEWLTPALSTIRQDFTTIGHEAMEALLAVFADSKSAPGSRLVPVEYVARESVAAPQNAIAQEA